MRNNVSLDRGDGSGCAFFAVWLVFSLAFLLLAIMRFGVLLGVVLWFGASCVFASLLFLAGLLYGAIQTRRESEDPEWELRREI